MRKTHFLHRSRQNFVTSLCVRLNRTMLLNDEQWFLVRQPINDLPPTSPTRPQDLATVVNFFQRKPATKICRFDIADPRFLTTPPWWTSRAKRRVPEPTSLADFATSELRCLYLAWSYLITSCRPLLTFSSLTLFDFLGFWILDAWLRLKMFT